MLRVGRVSISNTFLSDEGDCQCERARRGSVGTSIFLGASVAMGHAGVL